MHVHNFVLQQQSHQYYMWWDFWGVLISVKALSEGFVPLNGHCFIEMLCSES